MNKGLLLFSILSLIFGLSYMVNIPVLSGLIKNFDAKYVLLFLGGIGLVFVIWKRRGY